MKILFCLLVGFQLSFSQDPIHLRINLLDQDSIPLPKKFKLKDEYRSEFELERALQGVLFKLYGHGFITASMDSISGNDSVKVAHLFRGRKYEWVKLGRGNLDNQTLNHVGYKEKLFNATSFRYSNLSKLLEKILKYNENNGYPFARVNLEDVQIADNEISASLHLEKNQLIIYDTLAIWGDTKMSKKYLSSYLGIKQGGLYDEAEVLQISKRIRELPFVEEEKPFKVIFVGEQAKVNLYLRDRRSSHFDFILGILPNNDITGRVLITGELNLHLISPFGTGKEIRLNWQRLQERTQKLDVGFRYPYVLGLPFGFDLGLNLFKRDTLYLDLEYNIGIQYLFSGGNYFEAFVNNKITNVLSIDTNQLKFTGRLPLYNDVRNTLFGVGYYFEKLDYRINPRKGFSLHVRGGAGTKRIKENSTIVSISDPENPGATFQSLYDSIELKTIQFKYTYRFDKYWPIKKRATLKTSISGGAFISDNIFESEMFRIGGYQLLRGFDEQEIFTSLYNVLTVEFRFLLSTNSYLSFFADGAYVEDRLGNTYSNDFPYGFGAGLAFETRAGLFGVNYALGSQQNNPINFKSAKIHFGYVNYF